MPETLVHMQKKSHFWLNHFSKTLKVILVLLSTFHFSHGQSVSVIEDSVHQTIGLKRLGPDITLQYELNHEVAGDVQSSSLSTKGNKQVRAVLRYDQNTVINFVRSEEEYWVELGPYTLDLDATELQKNLNSQHIYKDFLRDVRKSFDFATVQLVTRQGQQQYKVRSDSPNKRRILFVDVQTWLPVKHREVHHNNQNLDQTVSHFESYQVVDGKQLPTRIRVVRKYADGSVEEEVFNMSGISVGPQISATYFAKRGNL